MSDLGLPVSNQLRAGGSARAAEVICWGSTEALEAIKRTCQAVAARCHQTITTHHPADAQGNEVSTAS
jgi:hypothetical protein